jgi:CBS domain-containing protein
MKAADLMTPSPVCCSPDDTAQTIAQKMLESDCGCIPVIDEGGTQKLVGVVTDRDLACRCLAVGLGPDTRAADIMSRDVSCCSPGADAKEVQRVMTDRQVRRVPIVDDRGALVGIVAQADLARAANRDVVSDRDVGILVERISEPSQSSRSDATAAGSEMRL